MKIQMAGLPFRKKVGHIWEYYRWQILFGTILLLGILVAVSQCVSRQEPGFKVAFIDQYTLQQESRVALEESLRQYAPKDQNDEKTVEIIDIVLETEESSNRYSAMPGGKEVLAGMQIKFTTMIVANEALVFIVDEAGYADLRDNHDLLEPVGSLFPDIPNIEPYRISWDGLNVKPAIFEKSDMSEEEPPARYIVLRKVSGSRLEETEKGRAQIEQAKEIFKAIAEDKAG